MSNMVKKGVIPGNSRIRLPKDKFPPGEFYKIEQLNEKSFKFTIVEQVPNSFFFSNWIVMTIRRDHLIISYTKFLADS